MKESFFTGIFYWVSIIRNPVATIASADGPPTFTFPHGNDVIAKPAEGAVSIDGILANINPDDGICESKQTLADFSVKTDANDFLSVPTIDRQGNLSFTPTATGMISVDVGHADTGGRQQWS